MGIDYTVYLGVYAECSPPMVTKQESRWQCQYKKCKWFNEERERTSKFCDVCGKLLGESFRPVVESSVEPFDVSEEFGENLHFVHDHLRNSTTSHIWLPNVDFGVSRTDHFSPKYDGEQLTPISLEVIGSEGLMFKNFFAYELAILRKHYGDPNVVVKWGLICYQS